MRRLAATVLTAASACSHGDPPAAPAPTATLPVAASAGSASNDGEVRAVAAQLIAAAADCEPSRIVALIDRDAFAKRVAEAMSPRGSSTAFDTYVASGAAKLCATLARAEDVRVLRVHTVDGEPRALLRRMRRGPGYFDVRAAETKVVDIYAYTNGAWFSEQIAEELDPVVMDPAIAPRIDRAAQLDGVDKPAEALAALDALPEPARTTRAIQGWRVTLAGRVSPEAYRTALTERARYFPDLKSTATAEMGMAMARGDFTEALKQLDALDASVGGDPFLDTLRATTLAKRNGTGDLDRAATLAARAASAEPKLLMPQTTKLSIAMARGEWANAVSILDAIETGFGRLDEVAIRPLFNSKAFLASSEYQDWRARHP